MSQLARACCRLRIRSRRLSSIWSTSIVQGQHGRQLRFKTDNPKKHWELSAESLDVPKYRSLQEAIERHEILLSEQKRIRLELGFCKESIRKFNSLIAHHEQAEVEDVEVFSNRPPTKKYCVEKFGQEWWDEHSKKSTRKVLVMKKDKKT
eukprot:m.63425 g.63425  ORF g.63425 m.63425 type:complete len:150 (-) comp23277_c0_seq1:94-543(-)